MKQQELDKIETGANTVTSILHCTADSLDAGDIPEFMAIELIDLVESWVECDLQRSVVKRIFELTTLPEGANLLIKRYFNLAY